MALARLALSVEEASHWSVMEIKFESCFDGPVAGRGNYCPSNISVPTTFLMWEMKVFPPSLRFSGIIESKEVQI